MMQTSERTTPLRVPTSAADVAYVRAAYRAIDGLDPLLPAPAYYDEAGTAYVPHDYEEQETDRGRFYARARAAIGRFATAYGDDWIDEAWAQYRDGIYGVCLRHASPETIVEKNALIDRIEILAVAPQRDAAWETSLRRAVERLDALERPFCDYDRAYFGGSVSRDRCITAMRERFPAVFR